MIDHGRVGTYDEPDSFVGRGREIDELHRFALSMRAVTLCGAGGIGKTRLLLRLIAGLARDFPDGTFFVGLGDLRQPDLVAARVAAVIGVSEEPGVPLLDTLSDALRNRRLLLALDNCEHLIDACATLCQRLLASSPGLLVVATSREALRVAAEAVWQVPPLDLPPAGTDDPERAAGLRRGRAVHRPGRGGCPRLRPRPGQLRAGGGHLPGAGRAAAGHRAGRGLGPGAERRPDRRPAEQPVPPADRRGPERAAAAPDAAGHDRLEPRPAQPGRAGADAAAVGVRGLVPGDGRAGLLRRRAARRRGPQPAGRAGREVPGRARARRARPEPLPDAGHHPGLRRVPAGGGRRDRGPARAGCATTR